MTTMTVRQAGAQLQSGQASALAMTQESLARISDPAGQGGRAFVRVHKQPALAAARTADEERQRTGRRRGPLDGIAVSVKDLFDIEGEATPAGSRVLAEAPPAQHDAAVVQRLRAAGAVLVGRTNMTEFAFSGLGINPHYGTPLSPWDRGQGRIPGGSSSGAAVSVSDGMALAAVATDTGGSARIPAAFCGLTGFKPTAARISLQGAFPLSTSLDSVGAMGATVDCCALLDAAMAGSAWPRPADTPGTVLRLGVVVDYVMDDLDARVARAYERALSALSRSGVRVEEVRFPELLDLPAFNAKGGFAAYESHRLHARLLAEHAAAYDPRVASRIARGQHMDDADYRLLQAQRATFIEQAGVRFNGFDALVMPTVPIVAPLLAACEDETAYTRLNLQVLRNPTVVNFLDGCAVSLPCHARGEAPVGLSVFQAAQHDAPLLALAGRLEHHLATYDLGAAAH